MNKKGGKYCEKVYKRKTQYQNWERFRRQRQACMRPRSRLMNVDADCGQNIGAEGVGKIWRRSQQKILDPLFTKRPLTTPVFLLFCTVLILTP